MKRSIILLLLLVLVLTACGGNTEEAKIDQSGLTVDTPADIVQVIAYPPEPQSLTIVTEDGKELPATFYPAAVESAPIIVLMHWVGGSQTDWIEIAPWLQNRGQGGQGDGKYPWLDNSWFPAAPTDMGVAVLTFTYRGCDESGCMLLDIPGWVLDSQAAMKKASEMEGIDRTRIISMGASIGADGAADGCIWLNQNIPDAHCAGSLAFSAGNYLGIAYSQVVADLNTVSPVATVWCVYGAGDTEAASTCKPITESNYKPLEYEGSDHGMSLFKKDVSPSMFELMQDFLSETGI